MQFPADPRCRLFLASPEKRLGSTSTVHLILARLPDTGIAMNKGQLSILTCVTKNSESWNRHVTVADDSIRLYQTRHSA